MSGLIQRALPVCALLIVACAHSHTSSSTAQAAPNPPGSTLQTFSRLSASVDVAAVARSVVLCKTTETELRRQLGKPSRDGLLHGARVMNWIVQAESPGRYLGVLLDSRGVVVDLYWDIPTEVPWVPADQCAVR